MLSIGKFVFYPTQEDVDKKILPKHLTVITVKPAHLQNVKVKPSHSLSQVAAQRRVRKAKNHYLPPALKVRKVIKFKPNLVGTRFIDLACLSSQLEKMFNHAATCDICRLAALDIDKPIVLHGETSREGLAFVLSASCVGCNQTFQINTSRKIKGRSIR